MNKKMRKFLFLMGCGLPVIAVGMDYHEEKQLQERIKQGLVSALQVNEYIIPVKSAYHALKKEEALMYDSLEKNKLIIGKQIREINYKNRLRWRQLNVPVYSVDFSDVRSKIVYNVRNFVSKQVNIIFYRYSPPYFNNPSGYMQVRFFEHLITHSDITLLETSVIEGHTRDVGSSVKNKLSFFLKNELGALLNNQKGFCIELWSEGNVSDWVRVQNLYDFDESARRLALKPLGLQRQEVFRGRSLIRPRLRVDSVQKDKMVLGILVVGAVVLGVIVLKELYYFFG